MTEYSKQTLDIFTIKDMVDRVNSKFILTLIFYLNNNIHES